VEPISPPTAAAATTAGTRWRCARRSSRCAYVPPKYPGHSATVFVMFDETAGSPTTYAGPPADG